MTTSSSTDSNKEYSFDRDDDESQPIESVLIEKTEEIHELTANSANYSHLGAKSRDQKEFESLSLSQTTNGGVGGDSSKKIIMAKTSSSASSGKIITSDMNGGGGKQQIFESTSKPQSSKASKAVSNDDIKVEDSELTLPPMVVQSQSASFPISYWQNYFTSKFNSGKNIF